MSKPAVPPLQTSCLTCGTVYLFGSRARRCRERHIAAGFPEEQAAKRAAHADYRRNWRAEFDGSGIVVPFPDV